MQKYQLMCVESGAVRPAFILPKRGDSGGLKALLAFSFRIQALQMVNSDLKETRDYWRNKHPETHPIWVQ